MILASLVLAAPLRAQDTNSTDLSTEKDQVSYAIGYNIGMNLVRQGFDVDPDLIARGIGDVLHTNEPALSQTEAQRVLQSYQQTLMRKRQEHMAALAANNREEGAAWLAENAKKEGVQTLESGLQYKVLTDGTGEAIEARDTVQVNYRGTLIDGTEFDSSYSRGQPAQFKVTAVIPGWTEALQKMRVGDKWELFVPPDLAYGDRSRSPVISSRFLPPRKCKRAPRSRPSKPPTSNASRKKPAKPSRANSRQALRSPAAGSHTVRRGFSFVTGEVGAASHFTRSGVTLRLKSDAPGH